MLFADKVLVTVEVIDLTDSARQLYGDKADYIAGRKLPDHDYRFSLKTPTGGEVTFESDATAGRVAEYCAREGWIINATA
jgi:hypothetical protein